MRVSTPGLREAKRQATSRALAWAAFELARERGLDEVTIDDIADAAGYSRRTFANHFSCKEQAVAAVALDQVRRGLETLPPLPDDLPLLDWLAALARHQVSEGLLTRFRELTALSVQAPTLEPYLADVQRQIRLLGQAAIAARAGSDASPLHVRILAGAVYGAITSVLDGPVPVPLPEFLDTVFTHLRTGF